MSIWQYPGRSERAGLTVATMSSDTSLADILASSTRARKVYRVWCETEGAHVSSGTFMDAAPSTCPNDETHTIDPSSVTVTAAEAPVAVPALEALARYFATKPVLQNIMSSPAVTLSKNSAFERVVSFAWTSGRPLLAVTVRGISGAKKFAAGGETLELAVVDVATNVTSGSQTFAIVDQQAQTLWVDVNASGLEAHYELLASSSEAFTIECVAAWG